jgi:proteasome assembly chaperone (PAC2) family protein
VQHDLEQPWLVTAWPGMGGVAQIAASYLVQKLRAAAIGEVDAAPWFDVEAVRVAGGLIQPGRLPRSVFYAWKNPGSGPDLLLFLGDKQPQTRGYRFCQELVGKAVSLGVSRVVTFAALGTPILPQAKPRVLAVATSRELLAQLRKKSIHVLEDGEIGGLNGVFLAAAAEQKIDGVGLLGEFPYFARAVPNPKASAAVLRVFANLAKLTIDMQEIDANAEEVERNMVEHLERMQKSVETSGASFPMPEPEKEEDLDPELAARIERLFEQARIDRDKAVDLKAELDRHGLFKQFEDRFLDLFKQAG